MNLIYNLINLERCDYNQFQNLRDETILKFRFPVGQASDLFNRGRSRPDYGVRGTDMKLFEIRGH